MKRVKLYEEFLNESQPYPSMKDVEDADKEQLARWYRFLPSPEGKSGIEVLNKILARFTELGGWNAELSKAIGWGN
jgi:hypothetical protein